MKKKEDNNHSSRFSKCTIVRVKQEFLGVISSCMPHIYTQGQRRKVKVFFILVVKKRVFFILSREEREEGGVVTSLTAKSL